MRITKEQVEELVRAVWSSVLGMEISSCEEVEVDPSPSHMITGFVHINGAWDGAVILDCAMGMAEQAVSVVFQYPPEQAEIEDIHDVLGELANMIGGGVKALLPGPCGLSLPAVVEGSDYRLVVRESRRLFQGTFSCNGQPLVVTVMERADNER